jgi:hypothetical protein
MYLSGWFEDVATGLRNPIMFEIFPFSFQDMTMYWARMTMSRE